MSEHDDNSDEFLSDFYRNRAKNNDNDEPISISDDEEPNIYASLQPLTMNDLYAYKYVKYASSESLHTSDVDADLNVIPSHTNVQKPQTVTSDAISPVSTTNLTSESVGDLP